MSPLLQLPPELLVGILSDLDYFDLVRLTRVCRAVKEILEVRNAA